MVVGTNFGVEFLREFEEFFSIGNHGLLAFFIEGAESSGGCDGVDVFGVAERTLVVLPAQLVRGTRLSRGNEGRRGD